MAITVVILLAVAWGLTFFAGKAGAPGFVSTGIWIVFGVIVLLYVAQSFGLLHSLDRPVPQVR